MDQYIGRLLDNRYEILEIIGTGGMAVVYKARCHRLNRLVAIKILKDEFARDEEFRRRFHAEGEAVAMLSHPNIVQVYDVSSSDNANFIVMELIDGITLKQYMEKKGVLNWKETLHFGMQIAKALEHAHGRSIVHRDIKPHNVMVLKNGSVKVTDFGIARVMSKSNTLTKEALGSVHYISPEQAKGGWVDNRSDLYSLGVVMYEMMSGRPPYDGESPVAVAIQHINGGAPMPSTLNPNIPGGLEQIIMKSMALDPKDRYSSATEMLKDMDEFRKDPTILFIFPSHGISDETKILKTPLVPQELTPPAAKPRTTAEKVAGTAAGAAGAAAAAAAAAARTQTRTSQQTAKYRTGDLPRTGSGAAKPSGSRPASSAQRPAAGTRPASGARPAGAAGRTPASGGNAARSASAEAARRAAANQKAREAMREEIREEERNRVATIAVIACSVVAIVAIVVFLIALVNGHLIGGNEDLLVPDLTGKYYETIDLDGYEGFTITLATHTYSDEVEEGKVIEQSPKPGDKVAQDTVIWLTVSMGPEPDIRIMTDLVGWDWVKAESYLKGQGMVPVMLEEVDPDAQPDTVIRTDPAADEELTEGQEVKVYYCVAETAEMLDVVGKDFEVAKKMLETKGFTNITSEPVPSDEKEGTVLEQSVKKGEEIPLDTEIVLSVAAAETAEMPNVVGRDVEVAKGILEGAGFKYVKVVEKDSDEKEGTVLKQSEKAGEEIAIETEIELTVAVVKKATMINVVGQQYQDAKDNLESLGFKNVTFEEVENNAEKGEVLKQSVAKNTKVAVDTEIVLTISKGPAPTDPPEVTKEIVIKLPADRTEAYVVGLYLNGKMILDEQLIEPGTTSITVKLTGTGVQEYDLYINRQPYEKIKVDFTANG
ncbi:MAG: PASTA domain-containing protein [Oscillospiraceae bacterium]|nr:PASTA domain-containing protein [Oscillospiraceae bacterium]